MPFTGARKMPQIYPNINRALPPFKGSPMATLTHFVQKEKESIFLGINCQNNYSFTSINLRQCYLDLRKWKKKNKTNRVDLFSQLYKYTWNFRIFCLLQLSGGAGENSCGDTALRSQGQILRDAEFVPKTANGSCECSDSPGSLSYTFILNTSV